MAAARKFPVPDRHIAVECHTACQAKRMDKSFRVHENLFNFVHNSEVRRLCIMGILFKKPLGSCREAKTDILQCPRGSEAMRK